MLIVALSLVGVSSVVFAEQQQQNNTNTTVQKKENIDGGDMGTVLCNAMRFVTGGVGKTIASFIIIGVGITFFTGKASWGLMIGVALGVSAMFGAPAIINAVTGGNDYFCKD